MGPMGPAGRSAEAAPSAYAQFTNAGAQTVAAGDPIVFDAQNAATGVTLAPSGTSIMLGEAGTYLIVPNINTETAGEFTVELNGAPVPGGALPANGTASAGAVLVNAAAGDSVSIVNTGADPVSLAAAANGAPNASVFVQRLGE